MRDHCIVDFNSLSTLIIDRLQSRGHVVRACNRSRHSLQPQEGRVSFTDLPSERRCRAVRVPEHRYACQARHEFFQELVLPGDRLVSQV
jgi:hypothetical protein